ncbi:BTAD domain-containing putative transcriptional regulator [Streptomyces malaysiensis]|uniref:BTAD domain-containing putative transcriptional regulator n=1 Tax=Streptomyces malaysiensis TaxID=92644 RepID=UPI0024C0DD13|nr:BTAD domain-containing putative transcriptional regulator [Streptomyces sp. NA07423]MCC4314116.1 tetratricopeptide repeat protein [Streptomyces malaysiensis]MCQ6245510.1 tetratricopeptide repeat protein [Streptomyces malaysiensis]WHX23197.1 BTAD domain-containing putative transcriptional regulator [Streptomyces sp. NA07423]
MRYRVLGSLELRDGEGWASLGPAKWRTLLAVLLCHANQTVSTERLLDELWGEGRAPQSATKLLQTYVSRLRQTMGDEAGQTLITEKQGYKAQGYRLAVEAAEFDAHRFEQLVEEGRRCLDREAPETAAERLREALAMWRGTPFADVPPTPAVAAEASRLEECRLQAVDARIDADLRCGRHTAVLRELEALTVEHPFREELRGRLMLALYRSGRQADALAVYRDLHRLLNEELGVEPTPPLRGLHERILNADASLMAPAAPEADRPSPAPRKAPRGPRQLPPASPAFTGRHGEVAVIQALMDAAGDPATDEGGRSVVLAAIDGTGGVGKSTLAIHVAHQLADRFPDGQLYVDLYGATAGQSALDPGEVLGRFLRALGVDGSNVPADADEASAQFRSLAAGRRLLVILDNAASVDQVRPLIPAGPGCAALVTSREMLTTLEGATHLHLDVLPQDQAVALLERVVGAERVGAEPAEAEEITRLCGGLPLALRIAGARLAARPAWPLRTLVTKLTDARGRLDELRFGDLAVRISFQVSYEAFRLGRRSDDLDAVRAFRLLSVVHGHDMSVPVAAALLDLPADRTENALERLVDAQLLESRDSVRYHMHDLLRLFASELAEQEEPEAERSAALERALTRYAATAQRAVTLLDPLRPWPRHPVEGPAVPLDGHDEAERWLKAELPNLLAAVAQAAEPARPEAIARLGLRLARALQWFLFPRAHAQDLSTVNELAIETARRLGDRESEAWALDGLSAAYWLLHSYDEVREALESALEIWRELGHREGELRSACNLADALCELGLFEEAITAQERQLALARAAGDLSAEVIGLGNLGRAHRGLGRPEDALTCFKESLEYARRTGNIHLEGFALYEIGITYMEQGRFPEGRTHMDQALPVWKRPGTYESWRGHTWSGLFPACMTLQIGPGPR